MSFFRTYLMPGLIFQSAMIGGGYATGRELVEYFVSAGPISGLLGMLIATIVFSVIIAITFEYGRLFKLFDYQSFFKKLLGPFAILYEVAYIAVMILILSVMGAAAGTLSEEYFGIPSLYATIFFSLACGVIVFFGSGLIEKVLSFWSILLYTVYIAVFAVTFSMFGGPILETISNATVEFGSAISGGLSYVGYNIALIPVLLFCIRRLNTRKEAIYAGLWAGPLCMIPAVLMFIALMAGYPEVNAQEVPSYYLIGLLDNPVVLLIFQIVVFGTFIETGTALLHGLNERIAHAAEASGKNFPDWMRTAVAVGVIILAVVLADMVGLIDLIATGYTTLSYVFWAVYLLPILTLGVKAIYFDKR